MEPNLPGTVFNEEEEDAVVNEYLKNFRELHRKSVAVRSDASDIASQSDSGGSDEEEEEGGTVGRGEEAERSEEGTVNSPGINCSPDSPGFAGMEVIDLENDTVTNNRSPPPLPRLSIGGATTSGQVTKGPNTPDHKKSRLPPERQRSGVSSSKRQRKSSRWSITQLSKQFCRASIEELYQRYRLRLQRRLLLRLLISLSGYHIILLILNNTVGSDITENISMFKVNIFIAVTGLLPALLAIPVAIRSIYYRTHAGFVISFIVWLYLNVVLFAYLPIVYGKFQKPISPSINVPLVVFFIFVINTMLPLSRKVSWFLSSVTAITDLTLTGLLSHVEQNIFIRELGANVIIYIGAVLTGLYHKHLTDIANRRTFLDTRKFIEADIKYSIQREKQNEMKEGLLLKIIPKHHLEDMKKMVNRKLVEIIGAYDNTVDPRKRMFHEFLVERHDDVSILYADIVNFTPLTSSLEPSDLVLALNQLFGNFDELAKANACMRIRMLGDCYYCVCGLPDPIADHARNCIVMGIQMIKVIRTIRKETGVDKLDMRIGVHTGYVLSGILGLKKWQYDVWSDDVTIANHMEASGLPGKVHITQRTKTELNDEFEVEPADENQRDEYLKESNIRTFFVKESEYQKMDEMVEREVTPSESERNNSVVCQPIASGIAAIGQPSHMVSPPGHVVSQSGHVVSVRRFSSFMQSMTAERPFDGLREYHQTAAGPQAAEVNRRLARSFYLEEKNRKQDDEKDRIQGHYQEINLLSLRFKKKKLEREYINKKDSYYKFYVFWAFILYIFLVAAQLIILDRMINLLIGMCVGVFIFTSLFLVTCLRFRILDIGSQKSQRYSNFYLSANRLLNFLISNNLSKICICFLTVSVIFIASAVPVINCQSDFWQTLENLSSVTDDYNTSTQTSQLTTIHFLPCLFAPYYTYSCMVTLIACSLFLRVTYIAKTSFMLVCLAVFNFLFYNVFYDVFTLYDTHFNVHYLSSTIRGSMHTTLLFVTLVMLDRQIEKNLRLDFLCKHEMKCDQEEVERNELINELLLVNILPKHVAEHFSKQSFNKTDLYHIICPDASIMFAAIPDFKAFFSEVDVTGKECLRLLNEIISSFDKMLLSNRFEGVEKMKTIGSTYMAAAGLKEVSHLKQDEQQMEGESLLLIVRFAFSMIRKLVDLSKDAFFEYRLRIGINHGKVIAGVVGASKPQFDIWGDAVNVASRMESHGVIGRIQITQETAEILERRGLKCEFRDQICVKGKGLMPVYLISDVYQRNESINSLDGQQNIGLLDKVTIVP